MPSAKNLTAIFTDIARSIRNKKGTNNTIKPYNMADEIDSITGGKEEQEKTVTPTKTKQEIRPDNDYTLSKVTVEAIPDQYVAVKGTKEINTNGVHYVQEYVAVNVNVVFDESSLIFAYYGEGV